MRIVGCALALTFSLGVTNAQAAECPNWELGTAIGLAKSCGMLKASEDQLRSSISVMANALKWECSPSELGNMRGAISDGMNYDRYDNHFELCGSMDHLKGFFKKLDTLAGTLSK
ncbi:MAG: hypothetical protein HOJ21_10280 [Alphaproteobacteria bacterium]|jgi:hypothetical protein|nr:hypothetical protein [Alphaproteobacteria bacterium]